MIEKVKQKPRKRRNWHIEDVVPGMCHNVRVITDWSEGGWFGPPCLAHAPIVARPGDTLEVRRGNRVIVGMISWVPTYPPQTPAVKDWRKVFAGFNLAAHLGYGGGHVWG